MKDIQYFCETIGIGPEAFYLDRFQGIPVLKSEFLMQREIVPYEVTQEQPILREAIHMYRNGIAQLLTELFMMEDFYRTFYGEDVDVEDFDGKTTK